MPYARPRSKYGLAVLVTHPQRSMVQYPVTPMQWLTISDSPEIAAHKISSTLVRKEGRLAVVNSRRLVARLIIARYRRRLATSTCSDIGMSSNDSTGSPRDHRSRATQGGPLGNFLAAAA